MIRRAVILLAVGLFVLYAGALVLGVQALKDSESRGASSAANVLAQSLAVGLVPAMAGQDLSLAASTVDHLFDPTRHGSMVLRGPQGKVIIDRNAPDTESRVPNWFGNLVGVETVSARAPLSVGIGANEVEVSLHKADAEYRLWRYALTLSLWALALGIVAVLILVATMRNALLPLRRAQEIARGISSGDFLSRADGGSEAAAVSEVQGIVSDVSMASWHVGKLSDEWRDSTALLESQGATDPVTGFLNRQATGEAILSLQGPAVLGLIELDETGVWYATLGARTSEERLAHIAGDLRSAIGADSAIWIGRLDGGRFVFGRSQTAPDRARDLMERIAAVLEENRERHGAGVVAVARYDGQPTIAESLTRLEIIAADARRRHDSVNSMPMAFTDMTDAPHAGLKSSSVRQSVIDAIESTFKICFRPVIDRSGDILHMVAVPEFEIGGKVLRGAAACRECAGFDLGRHLDEKSLAGIFAAVEYSGGVSVPVAMGIAVDSFLDASFRTGVRTIKAGSDFLSTLILEVEEGVLEQATPDVVTACIDELRAAGISVGVTRVGLSPAGFLFAPGDGLAHLKLASGFAAIPHERGAFEYLVTQLRRQATAASPHIIATGVNDRVSFESVVKSGCYGAMGDYPGLPTTTLPR